MAYAAGAPLYCVPILRILRLLHVRAVRLDLKTAELNLSVTETPQCLVSYCTCVILHVYPMSECARGLLGGVAAGQLFLCKTRAHVDDAVDLRALGVLSLVLARGLERLQVQLPSETLAGCSPDTLEIVLSLGHPSAQHHFPLCCNEMLLS